MDHKTKDLFINEIGNGQAGSRQAKIHSELRRKVAV